MATSRGDLHDKVEAGSGENMDLIRASGVIMELQLISLTAPPRESPTQHIDHVGPAMMEIGRFVNRSPVPDLGAWEMFELLHHHDEDRDYKRRLFHEDDIYGSGAGRKAEGEDGKEMVSWSEGTGEESRAEEVEGGETDVSEESESEEAKDGDNMDADVVVVVDELEYGGLVMETDQELEIVPSIEECRKGGSKTCRTAPAKSSEVEGTAAEDDEMVGDEIRMDAMEVDRKDGSGEAPQVGHDHEITLASTRPRRMTRPPDRLHENADVFYDFQVDDLISSHGDESETDDGDVPCHTHVLKHMQAEMDAISDSEYTSGQDKLGKERQRHEEESWKNGKIIKPELNGWAQIAAPNYYVYLQRSVPTGHWYIGYTSKPWTRLLEHNGIIGNGHNLGKYTQDESKRPWKIMLLVEGFENNIAAQGFEQTWARRHPNLQEDRISGVGHFIQTFIQVLHKQTSGRHLLDLRFFDRKSFNSWQRQVSGGFYRQAPLKIVDNVHEDVPGWDKHKTSEQFKNHPLQVMKRELRDYSLHHEHLTRGRRLITESNVKHTCTICHKVTGDEDGKGKAIFEQGIDGPVTPTPLMVLCPSEGCVAVSHMTCLAYQNFQDEKNAGDPEDYEHITLPVPISGNCRMCGNKGDWKDYRREIIVRLKASHDFWRKVWRREAQNRKALRLAERRMNEAARGLDVLILKAASPTARPSVNQHGIRQVIFTGCKEVTLAIQNAICGQVVTGDIHRLGWYEKIILGDHICIERIHEWLNNHIDNHKFMMVLPVQDDIFNNHVSLAEIKNFLDASSIYWAHWENSRVDERVKKYTETVLAVEDDKDAWRRRKGPGKGVFKENDTYWMWEDDMEKRTALGGAWLDAVALRGTNASPAVAAEIAALAEAARERAARLLEDVKFREWDKPLRKEEDEKEWERQNAMRVLKMEQRVSQRLLNSVKPPLGIVEQLREQREEMKKLSRGSRQRQVEMARRRGIAKVRNKWRERDNANAIKRRRIRHIVERKRRYTLAGTPTTGPANWKLGPRRNKPKTRVRYADKVVVPLDSRTRSAFVPEVESSEDEDMEDYDADDSAFSSDSWDSENDDPGLSSNGWSTSPDDSDNGSDEEPDLTQISAVDRGTRSKNQELLRLLGEFMERAGYCIDAVSPDPTIGSHEQPHAPGTPLYPCSDDNVNMLEESSPEFQDQLHPPNTPPPSRLSSAEIERNSLPQTPKRKGAPKQPSSAKLAYQARRAAFLTTPPQTPQRRARPGNIPPYVSPTYISTPGRPDDPARIEAAMRQHREAYDDRYFPLEEVKRGRRCFEGRHVIL